MQATGIGREAVHIEFQSDGIPIVGSWDTVVDQFIHGGGLAGRGPWMRLFFRIIIVIPRREEAGGEEDAGVHLAGGSRLDIGIEAGGGASGVRLRGSVGAVESHGFGYDGRGPGKGDEGGHIVRGVISLGGIGIGVRVIVHLDMVVLFEAVTAEDIVANDGLVDGSNAERMPAGLTSLRISEKRSLQAATDPGAVKNLSPRVYVDRTEHFPVPNITQAVRVLHRERYNDIGSLLIWKI